MNTISLSWLPLAWWWPVAVLLSAALPAAAVVWLFFKQKQALARTQSARIAIIFAAFAVLWWAFGFALALWPAVFQRDFRVPELRLTNPYVLLETGPDGIGNWVFDLEDSRGKQPELRSLWIHG